MNEGRRIAIARDEFFASLSGATISGAPTGVCLRNRLELAFIEGWKAAKLDAPAASDASPIYLLYIGERFARRTADAKAALAHFNGGTGRVVIVAEDHMYQAQRESDFPSAAHS